MITPKKFVSNTPLTVARSTAPGVCRQARQRFPRC
jgi:hypothetical protein